MVNHGYVQMGCPDCHKYNGRRWIGSCIPLQSAITVKSEYAVHSSSPTGASCILPSVSLELSKHQTHIYIPPWRRTVWLYVLHYQWIPSMRGCTSQQRNSVLFIYTCSMKLGPIYISVFNQEFSYYEYYSFWLTWYIMKFK